VIKLKYVNAQMEYIFRKLSIYIHSASILLFGSLLSVFNKSSVGGQTPPVSLKKRERASIFPCRGI
jgi:hypothetical protein